MLLKWAIIPTFQHSTATDLGILWHVFLPAFGCWIESSYTRPTDPFTILELQNPSYGVPELHKMIQSPDREALKLSKIRFVHLGPRMKGF